MEISVPEISLVVLVGASGSGKSTFARKHFSATEILSSDYCRALVADDENDQSVTRDAFEVLHFIARKRLEKGRIVVIDATNVQADARKPLVALAREYHAIPVAIVLNMPEAVCHDRNAKRPDRSFGSHVVRNQTRDLRRSLRDLKREGFRNITIIDSPEQLESVQITRAPMWNNKKHEHGPFDIIGDIHGCFDELTELLTEMGYRVDEHASSDSAETKRYVVTPPPGRRAFFVGDLVDRGPKSNEVLRIAMDMVDAGVALCVPGNHEFKLHRKLSGKDVKVSHGLAETLAQLETESPAFIERVKLFIEGLVSHYVLDDGKLVVAHAGMKEAYQGRGSGTVRSFALYGETTGETDEYGLPIRFNWAAEYRGKAAVVYGHTPVAEAQWLNNTLCIDTGCVFGGHLTALRYPERELLSVPARQVYYESVKPLSVASTRAELSLQHAHDDMLDIGDVLGKRHIVTGQNRTVILREENALAALEVMTRFAVHPKWLNYLPPTMSPTETSEMPGFLERPEQAFGYYQRHGVSQVVCEEKHMGSRAIVTICKSSDAARERFGITTGEIGICYTRTGRRFFNDRGLEAQFLARVQTAVHHAGLWNNLDTPWLTLDCELMPWSLKALDLVRNQYAAVGSAGSGALGAVTESLQIAASRGAPVDTLLKQHRARLDHVERYIAAYRRYCWSASAVDDLKLAPFHLLASEGHVHVDKDHRWHMDTLARLAATADPLLIATPYRVVELEDADNVANAIQWWTDLTQAGGEGVVVKPLQFIAKSRKGPIQPAIKCRGPEYLRIIYGPEYLDPDKLQRLRERGLSGKRQLAMREFELGVESLQRFVRRAPLRSVHECVLGILALESEPVDPRL